MRKLFSFSILSLACASAFATGKEVPVIPQSIINSNQHFYVKPVLNSTVSADSSANSSSSSDSSAVTGDSNSGVNFSNQTKGSNTYVFPAPVSAAPLPGNLCPQGDSSSWGVGWNFISHSRSSTRTEMECLEKVLAALNPKVPEVKVVEVVKEVVVRIPEIVYVDRIVEKVVEKCTAPAKKSVVAKKPVLQCK